MITSATTGFRGAATVMEIIGRLLPDPTSTVSANGGQWWMLRLGLNELTRPKEQADDWVWLFDHTIQSGKEKCLIVVGVRLSAWEAKRADENRSNALEHRDLSMWAIEVVDKSSIDIVNQQLSELSTQTGIVPRGLLSDSGADLKGGAELFQQDHPQTIAVKDIAHGVANAIKRRLNGDDQWNQFIKDAKMAGAQIRQTELAFLVPPQLKAKARWMNLEPLISWCRNVMAFLDNPLRVNEMNIDAERLEDKLGWIRSYSQPIDEWAILLEVAGASLKYVRDHGYHQQTPVELSELLLPYDEGPAASVATEILNFVTEQCNQVPPGTRMLGSSEVLESLIGKGKQVMGRNTKSGYTKTILGLAANVVEFTASAVEQALSAIKVRDVTQWLNHHLEPSLRSKRQTAFGKEKPDKKPDKLTATA